MHRKDCTKILGNPHLKSGSGRHPGNPHRNHDSTPQSQCNPVSIRRLCQDGNSDRNRHNQIELQQDCKTAKDCQRIERIAPKSRTIHNPRPDQSAFQAICTAIAMQIHNRITINAIRLQSTKSNWIATRLPGDRRIAPKSRDIHKLQPTVPDCPQNPPEFPQCLHNLLQFRAIQRIGTGLQIRCNPVSTRPTGLRIATERPQESQSRPSFAIHPGRNRHNQTRLQLDCKTTKDCNSIGRVASKLHGLQGNRDQQSIEVAAN